MQTTSQNHTAMLRDLLNQRLAALRDDVRAAASARRPLGELGVTDRQEDADLRQHAVLDEAQEQRDLLELEQVEAALHRVAAGAYGDCADCGDAISWRRLLAQPAAERCAPCQAEHERRQALQHGA